MSGGTVYVKHLRYKTSLTIDCRKTFIKYLGAYLMLDLPD